MAIEVFNRYENKYLINSDDYIRIRSILPRYMKMDEYNVAGACYTISNIYYDTFDNALIRNSLAKTRYKEKLRLRSYGVPKLDDLVYLEIKKKYHGLVTKRRTAIQLKDVYEFLEIKDKPLYKDCMNKQVLCELDYFITHNDLEPKLYLAYDRVAYLGIEQPDLRISFDTNIRTRSEDLLLEKGDYGIPVLEDGVWLMEIKTDHAIPLWLSQLLEKYQIYSSSFSKYGKAYQNYAASSLKGEKKKCSSCLTALQNQPSQLIPIF